VGDRSLLSTVGPVVAVGALLGIRRSETPLRDSDVLWATRAGLDIISSGHLPRHATHSWTAAGRPWTPNSWGWDVILGATYRVGGLTALGVLDIAVVIGLAFAVAVVAARIGAHPWWTAFVFAVVGLFVSPDLRLRPQAVAYVMIFALPMLLPRVLLGDRRSAWLAAAGICGLQILWMNLHSSAVIGPVMLALGGAGLLLREHKDRSAQWSRVGRLIPLVVAAGACCLVTPYGTDLITNIEEVRHSSIGLISEWRPAGIHGTGPVVGLVAIGLAVVCGGFAIRAHRYDTAANLGIFAVATGSAVRFTPILLLLSIPELAVLVGRFNVREVFLRRTVAAGCLVLAVFAVAGLGSFAHVEQAVGSQRLVAAIPHGCKTVNDYTIGGAIMLARPDVQVSVDGRNDMYGRSLLLSVEGMLSNDRGTVQRIDAEHVECVVTESGDKLVSVLEALPNWEVAGTDDHRTLLLRVSP
jgi:hypothetical protein